MLKQKSVKNVIEDDFLEDEDREGDVLILDPTLP
jgi:hypothetical protein